MKVIIPLICVLIACSTEVLVASAQLPTPADQVLTGDEVTIRESIDALGDRFDSDADYDLSYDEDDESDGNSTLSATVTDDGMIQIEDELLTPEQFELLYPPVRMQLKSDGTKQPVTVHKRMAIGSSDYYWPNGRIPYTYSTTLDGSTSKVRSAMNIWQRSTCLQFVPKTSADKHYVIIRTKTDSQGIHINECTSSVGKQRTAPQYLNLGKNCFGQHTILHELGHTIGLHHEHQHPDRDRFVTINWNNIQPGKDIWFKTKTSNVNTFGVQYDPQSIMHYHSTAFSKCQTCTTILHKSGLKVGNAPTISTKSDIPKVKKMYGCK